MGAIGARIELFVTLMGSNLLRVATPELPENLHDRLLRSPSPPASLGGPPLRLPLLVKIRKIWRCSEAAWLHNCGWTQNRP